MYEYFLIQADSAEGMNRKVKEMLAQGWEPYMGLTVGMHEYGWLCLFQWMSRIAPPPAPPQKETHHLERGEESLPAEDAGRKVPAPSATSRDEPVWLHTSVAAGENL
jgi:hypothetical protein